jgi:3-oxoadipate enol-lactonase
MTTQFVSGLAVEIDGDSAGEAVLCIHGLGGSSNVWTPLTPAFAGFKVLRPDLPGSARSALPHDKLSIAGYVTALVQLLDALEVSAVHVVAHSLGTVVAQHLAVNHPTRVKSLALFGPLVAPPDAGRPGTLARAQLARSGPAAMQDIADAIVQAATAKETKAQQPAVLALIREIVMRQPHEGYAQSCEALAAAQSAAIEQITVPTLLVTGDQDGVAPAANVAAMAARIAGSTQTVLAHCGHWTPFEQPQQCIEQLQHFYAGFR